MTFYNNFNNINFEYSLDNSWIVRWKNSQILMLSRSFTSVMWDLDWNIVQLLSLHYPIGKHARKFKNNMLVFKTDGIYPPTGTTQDHLLQMFQFPFLRNPRHFLTVTFICHIVKCSIDCPHPLMHIEIYVPPRLLRSTSIFHLSTVWTTFL